MRIGINSLFLVAGKGGGIERYLRGLIAGLKHIDKKNEYLIFTNRNCKGTFDLSNNFKEIYCNASAIFRPAKILWEQCILPWQLKWHKIDVLLSIGNIAPAIHSCPSIAVIHDMIPFIRPEGFNRIELFMLKKLFALTAKRSSKIITDSMFSKREIIKRFNVADDKVEVIYGACDEYFKPSKLDKQDRLSEYGINAPYILYVASSRPYKNIDGLIKAYKILKNKYKVKHNLVIVGLAGKAYPSLVNLIKELNVERDVIFSGFVEEVNLPLVYSGADIFVYPSFYEGFGLPVLEAMACGTPVAASNAASIPEVIGNAGLLFDPYNIEQMAEVIYGVIKEDILREALIKKGFKRVREFSWEKTAMQALTVLSDAYAKRYN